jgi:hypothetical protein
MPEETGEVYHVWRKSKEKGCKNSLSFVDVSYAVNTIYEWYKKGSKECRE